MFSGIIEAQANVALCKKINKSLVITLSRPTHFTDIKIGDSVSVNGVCLTIETFSTESIQFTIGHETLKVTNWTEEDLLCSPLNLERSLRFGDRIHGHMVTGHVDEMAGIVYKKYEGDCLVLKLQLSSHLSGLIWTKGSVTINGVSLTVNELCKNNIIEVCLVPETLRQTNLVNCSLEDLLCVEVDNFARAIYRYFDSQKTHPFIHSNIAKETLAHE
jgi:riboflavin synthase